MITMTLLMLQFNAVITVIWTSYFSQKLRVDVLQTAISFDLFEKAVFTQNLREITATSALQIEAGIV